MTALNAFAAGFLLPSVILAAGSGDFVWAGLTAALCVANGACVIYWGKGGAR